MGFKPESQQQWVYSGVLSGGCQSHACGRHLRGIASVSWQGGCSRGGVLCWQLTVETATPGVPEVSEEGPCCSAPPVGARGGPVPPTNWGCAPGGLPGDLVLVLLWEDLIRHWNQQCGTISMVRSRLLSSTGFIQKVDSFSGGTWSSSWAVRASTYWWMNFSL